jgi:opacity protein-like surface antigen
MSCEGRRTRPLAMAMLICLGVLGVGESAHAGFSPGEMFMKENRSFALAMWTVGSIGFSTVAYYMYKNSPAQRAKGYPEELGLGEWYIGGYTGFSYLPPADWKFDAKFPAPYGARTAQDISYQPGILGGIKFGRYLDKYPWFGIEIETNFSRNNLHRDQGRISPPVGGGPLYLYAGSDWFMTWAMQTNLLARYGFLKDKEVTFGRLQPYVGIGPGFEIIYGQYDSAKNFAIETLGGIRYMCTSKIAIFCEYKFSYQFNVEYQNVLVAKFSQGGNNDNGTMRFDVPHHRFVIGISYHFKNLYGN